MRLKKRMIMTYAIFTMFITLLPVPHVFGAFGEDITPVDVYYLSKSIDDSLVSLYSLSYEFQKKKLSDNARPRNNYHQAVSMVKEFSLLHPGAIDKARLDAARRIDVVTAKPADLFAVISLIKDYLVSEGHYMEHDGERTPRTPSDVTHMLRQISYHHLEIAKQKNIRTDWATPAREYDAIMNEIVPVVHQLAEDAGYPYTPYEFPTQPVRGILPLNISQLLQHIYSNLSGYYIRKIDYEPLILTEINECDDIASGDSFYLIKAITPELRLMAGRVRPDPDMAAKYDRWKQSKPEIVTGDVFRLLQYVYILSEKILESEAQ